MAMPSGPTTTMLLGSACWFACSLMVLVCPLPDSGRAGGGPDPVGADERQDRVAGGWWGGGAWAAPGPSDSDSPPWRGVLDSGVRCPTLGERRSSGLVGHVILLPIRAEGDGLG